MTVFNIATSLAYILALVYITLDYRVQLQLHRIRALADSYAEAKGVHKYLPEVAADIRKALEG